MPTARLLRGRAPWPFPNIVLFRSVALEDVLAIATRLELDPAEPAIGEAIARYAASVAAIESDLVLPNLERARAVEGRLTPRDPEFLEERAWKRKLTEQAERALGLAEERLLEEFRAAAPEAAASDLDLLALTRRHERAWGSYFAGGSVLGAVPTAIGFVLRDGDFDLIESEADREAGMELLRSSVALLERLRSRWAADLVKLDEVMVAQLARDPATVDALELASRWDRVVSSQAHVGRNLRDVNRRVLQWADRGLPSARAEAVRASWLAATYRDLYPDRQSALGWFVRALEADDLTDDQRHALAFAEQEYRGRLDQANRALERAAEAQFEITLALSVRATDMEDAAGAFDAGLTGRELLHGEYTERLAAILTPAQLDALAASTDPRTRAR